MIAWVFGGYFAAIVISQVRGTLFRGRGHVIYRFLLLAGYAVFTGLLGAWLVTGAIDVISAGHFWAIVLSGMLIVFAVATVTSAIQLLLGLLGTSAPGEDAVALATGGATAV